MSLKSRDDEIKNTIFYTYQYNAVCDRANYSRRIQEVQETGAKVGFEVLNACGHDLGVFLGLPVRLLY